MNDKENLVLAALSILVKLGESEGLMKIDYASFPKANYFGIFWQKWPEILDAWSTDKIHSLLKGFVYVEKLKPLYGFGSPCPVPQIYKLYSARVSDEESTITAQWILAKTLNDYSPFGSHNHGAKSLEELAIQRHLQEQKKLATGAQEASRALDAKINRAREATLRLPRAIERKDDKAITALILKGADPDFLLDDGRTTRQIAKAAGKEALLAIARQHAFKAY